MSTLLTQLWIDCTMHMEWPRGPGFLTQKSLQKSLSTLPSIIKTKRQVLVHSVQKRCLLSVLITCGKLTNKQRCLLNLPKLVQFLIICLQFLRIKWFSAEKISLLMSKIDKVLYTIQTLRQVKTSLHKLMGLKPKVKQYLSIISQRSQSNTCKLKMPKRNKREDKEWLNKYRRAKKCRAFNVSQLKRD